MPPKVRVTSLQVILLVVLSSACSAFAQTSIDDIHITPRERTIQELATSASASPSPGSLIRTTAELVMVPVTITDGLNRPVVGLDQHNFQVFENKKPQEIKHFSSEDAPVTIGILLDVSGSMGYKLDRAREAVAQFCDAANPQDEFFTITFSNQPLLMTDFTTHPENVENDLLTARSKGQTSLLDAIYMGLRKMRNARYHRRALLILSDGGDNHSRYTERDVQSAIKEADVMIYAVGTYERHAPTEEELLGPELLRSITSVTGGTAFALTNANDMPEVTRKIGVQLRHQYVLAYQPPVHRDGKWHKISVKLRLPRKFDFLHIDARQGYYAGSGAE